MDTIIKKYTFDNFVVQKNNELAYRASLVTAVSPGSYNPLFIFGGSGSGKTHLLRAIGNHISETTPFRVHYLSIGSWNLPWASVDSDVLLIDNIQSLSPKSQDQEGFVHMFDLLHVSGKQIVLAGTHHPQEMLSSSMLVRSRLGWGLIVDIQDSEKNARTECSIEEVQQGVAHFFNIRVSEILSYKRNRVFAYPRHIAMYLSHKLLSLTFMEVARGFQKKDHTTVMYAVEKIKRACTKDEKVKNTIRGIELLIKKESKSKGS